MHKYTKDQIADAEADVFFGTDYDELYRVEHPGRYFLHQALRSARESILKEGLIPHAPFKDGNWTNIRALKKEFDALDCDIHDFLNAPRGIYCYPCGDKPDVPCASYCASPYGDLTIPGHKHEPMDFWMIDGQGIPHVKDPNCLEAVVLTKPVPPDRLTQVNPIA